MGESENSHSIAKSPQQHTRKPITEDVIESKLVHVTKERAGIRAEGSVPPYDASQP